MIKEMINIMTNNLIPGIINEFANVVMNFTTIIVNGHPLIQY